mgnify:CR=1 FL=1
MKKGVKTKIVFVITLSLLLSACGVTAEIPVGVATGETALSITGEGDWASSEEMDVVLPDDEMWPELLFAQGFVKDNVWLPFETKLEVENIPQNPELPNGCEITSATIALNYLRFSVDKVTLSNEYLPMGFPHWAVDPDEAFMGDPADDTSFYCQPGPVVEAVNAYLEDVGAEYIAVDISGASVGELYEWVASGTPVVVWATRMLESSRYSDSFLLPDGSWPYSNSHCMVLTGYNTESCYLDDPMLELSEVSSSLFAQRYQERGQYAMVIIPTE